MASRKLEKKIVNHLKGLKKSGALFDGKKDMEIARLLMINADEVFQIRKKHDFLNPYEKKRFQQERRKIIEAGAGIILLSTVGSITYFLTKAPSYLDAVNNPDKRQDYLDNLVSGRIPEYVLSVEYATPNILAELKRKYDYASPFGASAATIPINQEKPGVQSKSTVYVFREAFIDWYKEKQGLNKSISKDEFYKDLEFITSNIIFKNEFTDAKNF